MYKTIEQTADFIKAIAPLVADNPFEIFLAFPFTAIQTAAQAAQGTKGLCNNNLPDWTVPKPRG
jgi:triosephosphate isomerase